MEKDLYSFKKPVEESGPIKVEYEQPKFFHRIMANLLDFLLFIGMLILLFIPTNAIIKNTSSYKNSDNIVNSRRRDSGLYTYYEKTKTYLTWPSYYDNYSEDSSGFAKVEQCSKAIDSFIVYLNNNASESSAKEVSKAFNEYALSKDYDGEKYFVLKDGVLTSNKESDGGTCKASSDDYYKNIYKPFIMSDCAGYLITMFPDYAESMKKMSNALFFIEIPVSLTLSCFLVYFVPGLFFRRGRQTLGKALFRVGLVDKNITSPRIGRYTARFFIFYGEIVLSLFTFALPLLISFSLMAFSKNKQGFPDYMLQLTEVDTSKAKIYLDKYDALVDVAKQNKEPIDFKLINKE